MESGSRPSVRYEVEIEDGMAALFAGEELIEAVQEEQLDSLLKEYFDSPKKVYIGMVESGAEIYSIRSAVKDNL